MEKIEKILDHVMRFLMAAAMGLLIVGGTWQVVSRSVLGNPSTVTDEFLRYMLIIASFIGAAYCFYKDEHLALELVTDRAHGTFKIILSVLIELAILFFVFYVFVIGGIKLVANATNISPVMHIPMRTLYLIEPICGIMIILARILKLVKFLSLRKKGEE